MVTDNAISKIEQKATNVFLKSCIQMSKSLLEMWTPEGNKRDRDESEKNFKEDLEDFFQTARCTKFDDDIQDYYEGRGKFADDGNKRRAPLIQDRDRATSLAFQSSNPLNQNGPKLLNKVKESQ